MEAKTASMGLQRMQNKVCKPTEFVNNTVKLLASLVRTWVWILTGVEWTSAPIYLSTFKCETGWPVSLACSIKWNPSPTLPWSQSRNPTCCRNSLPPSHRLQVHRFGIQIWQKVHKADWLLVLISSWRLILLREQLGNLCLSTTIL